MMMGVGAVRTDVKSMILSGIAGLVGGACSMAIGEFVSVYSKYDIEVAQMKRENRVTQIELEDNKDLPNPLQAAAASASAFAAGAELRLRGWRL
ncbi:unnamed protein product [Ilex paraguariensis]|uniref:Vacuolar iron transporter n=1 Tax=Ilex paraguariensis TaxID=185542 RepID=A0ABC8UBY6_9AQUA